MAIAVTTVIRRLFAENNDATEALSGPDLAKFLGPASPSLITWSRHVDRDVESYDGTANPPLSGIVSISIFLPPWKPDLGSMPTPDGPDRLGVLHGTWSRGVHDSIYLVGFGFADRKDRWLDINIHSPKQSDADQIALEVSRLPMFNSTPETPFRSLEIRKQLRRAVAWLLMPFLFLLTLWWPDRYLRRSGASRLRRVLIVMVISAVWIPALLALISSVQLIGRLSKLLEPAEWLVTPALASAFLLSGVVALLVMLLRKQWRRSPA